MAKVTVLFPGYSKQLDENRMDANCSCTLIRAEKNIIVDTMTAWDADKIVQALAEYELIPKDIDYVVCTHSHADHIGNNSLFLNAEHIVGHSVNRRTMFYEKNIKTEDYCICEGVTITATPGHTYEDVSVIVSNAEITAENNSKVCVVVAGDLFEKEEDTDDPRIWQELGVEKLRDVQAQMRHRILQIADFIVPGHGPMFRVTDTMRDTAKISIKCD